eukprot:TRINITY_DN10263_c0_g1_i3.p1 TRINITY_DN10263_c0_g1~~TRINITY_DN10263_c0_g1_i3.p1  ORF type:complete len:507 (-),score=137.91 TRINITY_DN10263_c0_g1_i3:588-2108(-)
MNASPLMAMLPAQGQTYPQPSPSSPLPFAQSHVHGLVKSPLVNVQGTIKHAPSPPFEQQEKFSSVQLDAPVANCSVCGTVTSLLRQGPHGKKCNDCWTNWNLRQLAIAQANAKSEYKKVMTSTEGEGQEDASRTLHTLLPSGRFSPAPHLPSSSYSSPVSSNTHKQAARTAAPATTPQHARPSHSSDTEDLSPPSSPYDADDREAGNGKDYYYCKYCETTWPLSFFRNRQQFGAHCSNCSRRRRPRDPSVMAHGVPGRRVRDDEDAEDTAPVERTFTRTPPRKKQKKPRSFADDRGYDSATATPLRDAYLRRVPALDHDSDSDTGPLEGDLLGRLVNVVEGKLVEMHELDVIRRELAQMRQEMARREEQKTVLINSTLGEVVGCLNDLRVQLASKLSDYEEAGLCEAEQARDSVLDEIHRAEALPQEHQQLATVLETRLDAMCDKVTGEARRAESAMVSDVSRCEEQVQDKITKLRRRLTSDAVDLRQRFLSLERTLNSPTPSRAH